MRWIMSDYEQIFHKQELYDMFSKGEVNPLDDLYGIEDLALTTREIENKIEFYKGLKRKKTKDINDAINVLENKLSFFKKVVLVTLEDNNEKSVDFPGSCRASSRRIAANWNITDEEEFIKIMEKAEEDGEKIDGVVEEVKESVIKKKFAKKLLDTWVKNGNFEKYIDAGESAPCVEKVPARKGVTFTFPKKEKENDEVIDETIPVKDNAAGSTVEEFDTL